MDKKNIDVSVIMPAYNADKFIRESIEGILNQNFRGSYELLLADDVSSDSTASIIRQYQEQYPQIIRAYYNENNLGCSDNSINLCQHARGKYLAFCDADDVWIDNRKLQKQYDFLESHAEYGMVYSYAKVNDKISGTNFAKKRGGY